MVYNYLYIYCNLALAQQQLNVHAQTPRGRLCTVTGKGGIAAVQCCPTTSVSYSSRVGAMAVAIIHGWHDIQWHSSSLAMSEG